MIRRDFFKTALAAGIAGAGSEAAEAAEGDTLATKPRRPRMMFYHDSRHPAIYMYEPPMEKEEFESAVDELAGTSVDCVNFGLGDGRTVFHDTKVSEVWGDPVKRWNHNVFRRAGKNVRMMLDSGQDPLRIIAERARDLGILFYPTLLLNQARRAEKREDDVRSSAYRWDNTHLEIGAKGDLQGFEFATNLDFKHDEVRRERFALIDEVLKNYPVDGFELFLSYKSTEVAFFHPKEVDAGREIMTEWIKKVHAAVKAIDPERELVIRLPADIDASYALGLDVREWIRQGIVDVVVGDTYQHMMDQTADFRPLVKAAENSNCRILPALRLLLLSDRLRSGTIEFMRAVACNYWAQGIDGLYLAQWFTSWPYNSTFYEQLREVGHPSVMAYKDKTYVVPTKSRDSQKGTPLPRELTVGETVKVEMPVEDDLPRWDNVGRVHEVMLRIRLGGGTATDQLEFRLNGKLLPDSQLRKISRVYRMRAPRFRVFGYWYIFRLEREYWPVKGENEIEVTLNHRDSDIVPGIQLRDVEFDLKYLSGKNFARGQDPDVGPYEVVM